MAVMIVKYFRCNTLVQLYESLHLTIKVLKWCSTILIFTKYMFQFKDYVSNVAVSQIYLQSSDPVSAQKTLLKYYERLPFVEKMLGMENSFVPIKLFSLALVMSLTNLQEKFLMYSYLTEMLREEDRWRRNSSGYLSFKSSDSRILRVWNYISTYSNFIGINFFQPVPAMCLVLYATLDPCPLNFLLVLTALWVTL